MSVPPFLPQPERRPAHDPSNATHEIALALADQLDCVLLACDAERHLLHANRAGCRALHSARILALDGDRVVCVAAPQREWSDAVRDAACRQQCRLFWVGGPSDQAMVVAIPIVIERLRTPAAIISMGRRAACSGLAMDLLATRYQLSFAERRVFGALLRNASPKQIAAAHGVTTQTIRAQIQAICAKLGVRTTVALLQRVAQLPPVGNGP